MSPDAMRSDATSRDLERRRPSRALKWMLGFMLLAVLASGAGFAYKLIQFLRDAQQPDGGAFGLPILVYALMAIGFACLLGWAAIRGMFHDIERPKFRMLEREKEYERHGI